MKHIKFILSIIVLFILFLLGITHSTIYCIITMSTYGGGYNITLCLLGDIISFISGTVMLFMIFFKLKEVFCK